MIYTAVYIGISFIITALIAAFAGISTAWIGAAVILMVFLAQTIFKKKKSVVKTGVILASVLVAATVYTGYAYKKSEICSSKDANVSIIGRVKQINKGDKTDSVILEVKESEFIKRKAIGLVYMPSGSETDIGDTIECEIKLYESGKSLNRYNKGKNIDFTGYSSDFQLIQKAKYLTLLETGRKLNGKFSAAFESYFKEDTAMILKSIILGNEYEKDSIVGYNAQKCGVLHIFVVSGLHISVLAQCLIMLLNLFKIDEKKSKIAVILLVWFYAAITGFNIPVIRAGLMLTIVHFAFVFGRQTCGVNSLFAAVTVILLFMPYSIYSYSFWLTFSATLGVCIFAGNISKHIKNKFTLKNKLLILIVDNIAVSFSASIFLIPISALLFKGVSFAAIVVNIMLMPILPVLIAAGFLFIIDSPIGVFSELFNLIIEICVKLLSVIINLFAKADFLYFGTDYDFTVAFVLLFAIFSGIFIIIKKREWLTVLSVAVIIGYCVCLIINKQVTAGRAEAVFFPVSDNSYNVVVTKDGTADVLIFEDNTKSMYSIRQYLTGKNITSVNSVVILGDIKYHSAFKVFSQTIKVDRLYYDFEYADKPLYFSYRECAEDIKDGESKNVGIGRIEKDINGVGYSFSSDRASCLITNSYTQANKSSCNYIFFTSDYKKIPIQIDNKYVILLKDHKNYKSTKIRSVFL